MQQCHNPTSITMITSVSRLTAHADNSYRSAPPMHDMSPVRTGQQKSDNSRIENNQPTQVTVAIKFKRTSRWLMDQCSAARA